MEIGAVIDEVARRHHLRLTPDDPILATLTVMDILHQSLAARLEAITTKAADNVTFRMEAEVVKAGQAIRSEIGLAQKSAADFFNQSGAWSADRLRTRTTEIENAIATAFSSGVATMEARIADADRARRIAVIAASTAVSLCMLVLGAAFGFWLGGR